MTTGPASPETPLELVAHLAAEPEHDRPTLEDRLGVRLREAGDRSNPYYDIYEGAPSDPAWLTGLELRRARQGTASLLIVELAPEPCVSKAAVFEEYGEPEDVELPSPHGGPRITYYGYRRGDDDLAFGFQPAAGGDCLAQAVFDRARGRCVEVVTIRSNTQAGFGGAVDIGAGNIWEGEYEDAAGNVRQGLSAALAVRARGAPDEEFTLRAGPGTRFEAAGDNFRVQEVETNGVTVCRVAAPGR